jgi:hypothetical protein
MVMALGALTRAVDRARRLIHELETSVAARISLGPRPWPPRERNHIFFFTAKVESGRRMSRLQLQLDKN